MSLIWDGYSKVYWLIETLFPFIEHQDRLLDDISAHKVTREIKIAEIGVGSGYLIQKLLERGYSNIYGIDISREMLMAVKSRIKNDNVRFILLDIAKDLPPSLREFDVAVLNNVLYAVKDPLFALQNIATMIKRGGTLLLSDPKPSFSYTKFMASHFKKQNSLWTVLRFIPLVPLYMLFLFWNLLIDFKARVKGEYSFYESSKIDQLALKAGFTIKNYSASYAQQNHYFILSKR